MDLKCYSGKNGKKLIKYIQNLPDGTSLPPLGLDQNAMKACKMNNDELKSARDPKYIPTDGNFKKL